VEAEGEPLRAIATLAAALKQAGLAAVDLDGPAEALADATRRALASARSPILVVLDNVDHPGWDALIPGGEVRLLVTTRDAQLALGDAQELEALASDPAMSLAVELAGECAAEDRDALREVVTTMLAGLPVAIEVAAKAVKGGVGTWRRYQKFLETEHAGVVRRVLDAPEFKSSNYPRGVFAAVTGSIEASSPAARNFLDAALVFAAENVPVAWIAEAARLDRDSLETARVISELAQRSLVKWNKSEDAISMHRLVHTCGREMVDPTAWAPTNQRGARCVRAWLEDALETSSPLAIEAKREHVRQALRAAELAQDYPNWVELADYLGTHLRNRGLYRESQAWLESCVDRAERVVGRDDKSLAFLLANLGSLLNVSGNAAAAKPLLQRAVTIAEKALGERHPSVAVRLADLATAHSRLREGEEALPLLERALEITEESFGPDHPRVATCLADLGALLVNDLWAPARARPFLERALRIDEASLGKRHPTLVGILVCLANALPPTEAEAAPALLQRAVDIVQSSPSRAWWDLSTDLRNLGRALNRFGMFAVAQGILERALALDRAISPAHPVVAADLWLLSLVSVAQDRRREAIPMLEEAGSILEAALGKDHADTVSVQRSLTRLSEQLQ